MWILLREHNEYDQYGEYFVAAWKEKPSEDTLYDLLKQCDITSYDPHLRNYAKVLDTVGHFGQHISYRLSEYTEGECY